MTTKAKGYRWPLGVIGQPSQAVNRLASDRFTFLCVLHEVEPRVLQELASADTDDSIDAWATRWNINTAWVLDYARSTRQEWLLYPKQAGRSWFDSMTQNPAWWTGGSGTLAGTAAYRHPDHYYWLAKFQVCEQPYLRVAGCSNLVPKVRDACVRLASLLELPLRNVTRGRPRLRP